MAISFTLTVRIPNKITDSGFDWRAKSMGKPRLELASPAKEKRTVAPRRRLNRELRPREHLTEFESKTDRSRKKEIATVSATPP
jgi:hypothetical protein